MTVPMTEMSQFVHDPVEEGKVTKSISNQQPKHEHQVNEKLYKCQWILCDRVFDGLDDLLNHALEVHGFYEEDGEESDSEVSMKTIKLEDEQSIEQVNAMNPIESTLSEIVSDGQSCAPSHDHAYDHQIDHLPSAPLNESASLICSFAECVDLTFNHQPSLLRHTRLKHSQSLHPKHCKPFTNVRRPTQSNHVLKNVSISKSKCLLCDKYFECIVVHVIQEHTVMEVVVTSGFGECTRTLDSDREDDQQINLDQFNSNPAQFDSNPTQSTSSNQSKCNLLQSQPVSSNLNQFCANLDQSSPSSIRPDTKSNSTLEHPNLTFIPPKTLSQPTTSKRSSQFKKFRTHKDIILHYRSSVSKEFKLPCDHYEMIRNRKDLLEQLRTYHGIYLDKPDLHESNPLPNQPVTMRLNQFSANLEQSIPSQFNPNPKFSLIPMNLSINSSTSPSQSNLENMVYDYQHAGNVEELSVGVQMGDDDNCEDGDGSLKHRENISDAVGQAQLVSNKEQSRKHVCEHCGKGFKRRYELIRHIRTHTSERPFKCPECVQTFTQNSPLQRHLVSQHNKLGKQACTYCDKTFQTPSDLENHVRTHTGQKPFLCTWKDCEKAFSAKNSLKTHRCIHTGERPYKCHWKNCNMAYTHRKQRICHFKMHTDGRPFVCPWEDCHEEFVGFKRFRVHVSQVHTLSTPLQANAFETHVKRMRFEEVVESGEVNDQNDERNDEAGEEYDDDETEVDEDFEEELLENGHRPKIQSNHQTGVITLDEDAESDNDKNKDKEMDVDDQHEDDQLNGLDYRSNIEVGDAHENKLTQNLKSGQVVGSIKRPTGKHVCEHCGKTYKVPSKLAIHTRTHTGYKPFPCTWDNCGKTFKIQSELTVHIRKHTGEKLFACDWENCGKKITQINHLNQHMYIHTGEKPHKCPWKDCTEVFTYDWKMRQHFMGHVDMTPFKCPWEDCHKKFSRIGDFRVHTKHHNEKIALPEKSPTGEYICEHCGRGFKKRFYLNRHIRTHTGERPYECPHCRKTFSQNNALKRHILVHTGERAHVCEQCRKAFRTKDDFKRHSKVHRRKTVEVSDGQL